LFFIITVSVFKSLCRQRTPFLTLLILRQHRDEQLSIWLEFYGLIKEDVLTIKMSGYRLAHN